MPANKQVDLEMQQKPTPSPQKQEPSPRKPEPSPEKETPVDLEDVKPVVSGKKTDKQQESAPELSDQSVTNK